MKLIKKKRILQLAEEAGLVFNREALGESFVIHPWHAQAIWDFYMKIEEEKEKIEKTTEDTKIPDSTE